MFCKLELYRTDELAHELFGLWSFSRARNPIKPYLVVVRGNVALSDVQEIYIYYIYIMFIMYSYLFIRTYKYLLCKRVEGQVRYIYYYSVPVVCAIIKEHSAHIIRTDVPGTSTVSSDIVVAVAVVVSGVVFTLTRSFYPTTSSALHPVS